MSFGSPKSLSLFGVAAFQRNVSWSVRTLGGLVLVVLFVSCLLISFPIGTAVRGYFYGVEVSENGNSSNSRLNLTTSDSRLGATVNISGEKLPLGSRPVIGSESELLVPSGSSPHIRSNPDSDLSKNLSSLNEKVDHFIPVAVVTSQTSDPKAEFVPAIDTISRNKTTNSIDSGCDLYQGNWIYDTLGPLYTNNTCPIITQMQNCQGNGRPDKEYENWRWKPSQCELPRFDPKKFLELMRGKTLAFIGDSVSRNQMESMLCILWQAEAPVNQGDKRMLRYYFPSTSTTVVRIWSSWLVHKTKEAFSFAPEGMDKLHLDAPDEYFMEFVPEFDVIVLSSGHWFVKQSAYILKNEIVGGQLWQPDKSHPMKVNNIEAFGISIETILTALVTHPNYTGLTIVRSFSPDHYEGGAWNTGGSCTGKTKPLAVGELVENGFTKVMHEKQITGFKRAVKKITNKSKLKLMDVTEVFSYRHDGHPGPYRNTDPNKITKRGPNGRPPPQDCLHWCMPGPVDTWNEIVLEIIKREFESSVSNVS